MFFDETIAAARDEKASLDNLLAAVMELDPDTSDADDFAHLQGLVRHVVESAQRWVDERIATLEKSEQYAQQLVKLEHTAEQSTAEIERIVASLR